MAFHVKLLMPCFSKSCSMVMKLSKNFASILHSVICSEINNASITNKRLLQKERG